MMTTRLHVNTIRSIGAVEDPDNEEAQILLYKSRPAGHEDRDVDPPSLPVSRGRTSTATVMKQMDRQSEALAAIGEDLQRIDNDQATMKGRRPVAATQRTAAEVLAEVNQLAKAIQKIKGKGTSIAAARADVWRAHPELATEHRAAQKAERELAKEAAQDIDRIVKGYCMANSATPEHMGMTLGQIRRRVLGSAIGQEIVKLRGDVMAGKVTPDQIAKSSEYSDAWSVLKQWDASGK